MGNEIMLKDSDWAYIYGELCKVVEFSPLASVKDGKVVALDIAAPYAAVSLEYKAKVIKGFVTHITGFFKSLDSISKDKRLCRRRSLDGMDSQTLQVQFPWIPIKIFPKNVGYGLSKGSIRNIERPEQPSRINRCCSIHG